MIDAGPARVLKRATRTLLFDLDGTLTDPRPGIVRCIEHSLKTLRLPAPPEQELAQWIGPPLHESFAEFLGKGREELVPLAVAHYRERFATIGIFENAVYPGVVECLQALTAGQFRLFLATSKPLPFAERILRHFQLSEFFAAIYGSEFSGERSNKAELIAHILTTESLSASSAIMIGDRKHDMLGARANGVRGFGALWGYGSRDELVKAGASELLTSLVDLPAALQRADDLDGRP